MKYENKKAKLFKFEENIEVQITPLRVVKGKFGQQIVAKKGTEEVFLPHNVDLNTKIQTIGLNKLLNVVLLQQGNKTMKSKYDIKEVTDQTTLI